MQVYMYVETPHAWAYIYTITAPRRVERRDALSRRDGEEKMRVTSRWRVRRARVRSIRPNRCRPVPARLANFTINNKGLRNYLRARGIVGWLGGGCADEVSCVRGACWRLQYVYFGIAGVFGVFGPLLWSVGFGLLVMCSKYTIQFLRASFLQTEDLVLVMLVCLCSYFSFIIT